MNRFYIVNSIDRPHERLIAEVVPCPENDLHLKLRYVHPDLIDYPLMSLTPEATPVADFGIECAIWVSEAGTSVTLAGRTVGKSVVKYPNGDIRKWQGASHFVVNLNPLLARIWSYEHARWRKANERGYTDEFEKAGLYPVMDALAIAQRANFNEDEPQESVVPCRGVFIIGGDEFTLREPTVLSRRAGR